MEKVIVNFKKFDVVAPSVEERDAMVPFTIYRDATTAYRKAVEESGVMSNDALRDFCLNYLKEKTKLAPGLGCAITVVSPSADTRERPYTVETIPHKDGKRTSKRWYRWIDEATGLPVEGCETNTNAADAHKLIKDAYSKGGYTGNAYLRIDNELSDNVIAKAKYTPSKNFRKGSWIVFGVENS